MTIGAVTYVHGWYTGYIPLFLRAWELAYPEYHVRIFCRDEPPAIVGADLRQFPSPHKAEKPYYMRWLLPPEAFEGLDYAFICDIDLLALREDPPLHEVRQRVMRETKRPFANWVRPPAEGYPSRFTGWHFIEVEPYYEAVWPHAKRVLADAGFDISRWPSYQYPDGFGGQQWGQEALLFQLLSRAFALGRMDFATKDWFANHHGLHLGPLRGGMPRDTIAGRLPLNVKFWNDREQATALLTDEQFQQRARDVKQPEIRLVLQRLYQLFDLPAL